MIDRPRRERKRISTACGFRRAHVPAARNAGAVSASACATSASARRSGCASLAHLRSRRSELEARMPSTQTLDVRPGQVLVMVGTMKGAFLFSSSAARTTWKRGGPHFAGSPVYALAHQSRPSHRLYASVENPFFGPSIRCSDDLGRTWTDEKASSIRFPESTGASLRRVWQLQPRGERMYAGVEPSALFVSDDRGGSWSLVQGLWDHPHRERWTPGNGGQCLHTVLPD